MEGATCKVVPFCVPFCLNLQINLHMSNIFRTFVPDFVIAKRINLFIA